MVGVPSAQRRPDPSDADKAKWKKTAKTLRQMGDLSEAQIQEFENRVALMVDQSDLPFDWEITDLKMLKRSVAQPVDSSDSDVKLVPLSTVPLMEEDMSVSFCSVYDICHINRMFCNLCIIMLCTYI